MRRRIGRPQMPRPFSRENIGSIPGSFAKTVSGQDSSAAHWKVPNKRSELSVRSPPSARKNPAFAPRRSKAKTCACSSTSTTSYRLQTVLLGTLRAHINKKHDTSRTGQLPIPSLCAHVPQWETLEKPSGDGSQSKAEGETSRYGPALGCSRRWGTGDGGKTRNRLDATA